MKKQTVSFYKLTDYINYIPDEIILPIGSNCPNGYTKSKERSEIFMKSDKRKHKFDKRECINFKTFVNQTKLGDKVIKTDSNEENKRLESRVEEMNARLDTSRDLFTDQCKMNRFLHNLVQDDKDRIRDLRHYAKDAKDIIVRLMNGEILLYEDYKAFLETNI